MWPFKDKQQQKNLNNHDKRILEQNELLRAISQFNNNFSQINSEFGGDEFVKNGYGGNADVYAIINYIITTASNVPLLLEIKQPDGTWKIDPDSELIKLINNPNETMGYSLLIEELLGWKLIDGNGYLYAPRLRNGQNKGKSQKLWVMPSNGVRVMGGGLTQIISGYTYDQWTGEIPPENVMTIRYFNPLGTLSGDKRAIFTGQSPLKAAEMVIKKLNTGALSEITAFANNGAIGVFSREGADGHFTPDHAEKLDRRWKQRYGGAANKNTIAHTPANIKYHKIGESPADLKVVEAALAAKRQIAAIFKFPTELLNDPDGSTFNNQQEAHKSLYTNVIIPEMRSIGEGINRWLAPSYYGEDVETRIVPNTSDIEVLQTNKKDQAEWLSKSHHLTLSEKRVIAGGEADPKLDDYYIPTNLIALDDIDKINEQELRDRVEDANANKE